MCVCVLFVLCVHVYQELFQFETEGTFTGQRPGERDLFYRNGLYIRNTYYNFVFPHESPGGAAALSSEPWPGGPYQYAEDGFRLFRERYDRRIENFRQYMRSEATTVLLLTASVYDVSQLEAAIRAQHPHASFRVHVLLSRLDAFAFQSDHYHRHLLNASSYFR
jgi:hypothetical protein